MFSMSLSTPAFCTSSPLFLNRAHLSVVRIVRPVTSSRPVCPRRSQARIIAENVPPSTEPAVTPSVPTSAVASSKTKGEDGDDEFSVDPKVTLGWIGVAMAVAAGIAKWKGSEAGLQFVTAYVLEYSLSVDNLFVFLLIFNYFRVPLASQGRVLGYGIGGALIMRGIMILAGSELTHRFHFVTLGFAALLIYSAVKLLLEGDEDDEDLSKSGIVRFARKLLPFTDAYDGDRFFTKIDGASFATPLMLVLLSVELSDVIFALDSVPAVLGISDDTAVIYLSNILAVAGLRNLFFILSESIGGLRFLPQSLAIVLGFVGCKMIAGVGGYEVGIVQSLSVVVGTLVAGVGLSVALPEEGGDAETMDKST